MGCLLCAASMPTVSEPILRRFACDVAAATGIPAEDARTIGDHYVDSHLSGHDSHGVFFLVRLADAMINNYVRWEEREVVRDNPSMTIIDGKGAHGIIALTKAVEIAVDKARSATFGCVCLRGVGHIGRLGAFPPLIAAQGMLGMVWHNGGGIFLPPHGSADRRLRPEPIAFSAPRRNGLPPFMLDMTMSTVAGGKIEQKIARGEALPGGWLIDHEGADVTDPSRFHDADETAIPPLGGAQFGHKGFGLAMMVEMIVGPLSGAGCTNPDGSKGGGVMVLAIDISAFTDLETYQSEVEDLAAWVGSARPLPGVNKVYCPGEIEEETRQRRLGGEGIDLPDSLWLELTQLANQLGVAVPDLP